MIPVSDSDWLSQAEPMVRHVVGRWSSFSILDRDDLAQICRMRLLELKPEFDPSVWEWPEWVFRVCDRCLSAVARKEARRNALCRRVHYPCRSRDDEDEPGSVESLDSVIADTKSESPGSSAMINDEADRLRRRVEGLRPSERRLVVRMFGLDGFEATETIAGTAAFFGMPLGECRAAIQRAMDVVRSGMAEDRDYADVA